MRLADQMSHPVEVARSDEKLLDAGKRMFELGVRHLPVVDGEGHLAGLLLDQLLLQLTDVGSLTVQAIAIDADVVAHPADDMMTALHRLHRSDQDIIVVVDAAGTPVGVLTEHDGVAIALEHVSPALEVDHEATYPCKTVTLTTRASLALATMRDEHIRHLVVTTGKDKVAGVLSLRDLTICGDLGTHTVDDVLTSRKVISVPLGTGLKKAAALMVEHRIGCVPIVDHRTQHPVGMITRADAIEAAVAALEDDALFP